MGTLLALTLFGSVVWFWIVTAVFVFICFASDLNKNGYYAFAAFIALIVVYNFWGDLKAILGFLTWTNVVIYLTIGFIYATVKTFFSGRKLKEKLENLPYERPDNVGYIHETKKEAKLKFINKLESNVTRWLLMWWVSLINWLFTDLFKDFFHLIYSKFRRFFEYVAELGMNSVK
jgi:hypothetical protein